MGKSCLTIGVAIQAETFSSSSPTPGCVPSSSTKSAIFLPPSKNGAPQTLKITFAYNKETNLPEVIVNFDEGGEEKYLKLKDLIADGGNGDLTNFKDFGNKQKDLQVYYFENMQNDNKGSTSQIIEVPAIMPSVSVQPPTESEAESKESSKTNTPSGGNLQHNEKESEIQKENSSTSGSEIAISKPETNSSGKKKVIKKVTVLDGRDDEEKAATTSPKSSDDGSSKSASKINGRSIKRKSNKSRSMEKRIPSSPSKSPERNISSPTKGMNDRSKIPVINSAATGFMPCEYYRQKWLQENGCIGTTDHPATWTNYSSIQKTAGQKVINKINQQQKKLEESAAAQKKRTEFVFHDELGFCEIPMTIPIRKKQTRLEPLRTIPNCC